MVELIFCFLSRVEGGGIDTDEADRPVCCVKTQGEDPLSLPHQALSFSAASSSQRIQCHILWSCLQLFHARRRWNPFLKESQFPQGKSAVISTCSLHASFMSCRSVDRLVVIVLSLMFQHSAFSACLFLVLLFLSGAWDLQSICQAFLSFLELLLCTSTGGSLSRVQAWARVIWKTSCCPCSSIFHHFDH